MSVLYKEPSLSVFNVSSSDGSCEDDKKDQNLERIVTVGESTDSDFSFQKNGMGLIEEEVEDQGQVSDETLCIGLGVKIGFDESKLPNLDYENDLEAYYKTMIEKCPDPLFLRNYAQILQSKGDLYGAEEYYSRASLADPEDGETWMRYAKLVWELHRDKDRASRYFKLATEFAPDDSIVLAAYASFLWGIDEEEEEDDDDTCRDHLQVEQKEESAPELNNSSSPRKKQENIAEGVEVDAPSITTPENLEVYYRKIIEDNPNDALFLGSYAKFLYESKGDLQGAEEYYSRAVLADPADGEITAQYAKLVWDLHHDGHKASVYFERAVQVSPENSHVLAAHASFLWEMEDDEEDDGSS